MSPAVNFHLALELRVKFFCIFGFIFLYRLFLGPSAEPGGGSCMYLLASGGNDDAVKIWRVSVTTPGDAQLKITLYTELTGHYSNVMCLAFAPNGCILASG